MKPWGKCLHNCVGYSPFVARRSAMPWSASVLVLLLLSFSLAGCSNHASFNAIHVTRAIHVNGSVFGGEQPVVGGLIQLYAVGTTGDGSAATPLISATVTTSDGSAAMNSNANDGNANNSLPMGTFAITGEYTCPTPSSEVYLVSTGGNPGLGLGTNDNLTLMAAMGQCGSLSSSTYVVLNELTTVSTVAALSNFITSYGNVGSGSSDSSLLQSAFSSVNEYANIATGTVPGPALPAGYSAPSIALQTVGDIVAACVNSTGGVAGDGSPCGQLFTLATISGNPAPTDTVGAIVNILHQPSVNVAQIFALLSANGPFQPTLSAAPTNWALPITSNTATQLAFTAPPSDTVAGSPISPAVAVVIEDASGNLQTWATNTVTLAIGANPGGGSLSGSTSVNAINGVATFSGISINDADFGYTLVASSAGLSGATSGIFNITVAKSTPTVSAWPSASALTYGQTLVSSMLTGGAASVPGAFTWTAPATAPPLGTSVQGVTFTPTDTIDYNSVTGSVELTVAPAPTIAYVSASSTNCNQTNASFGTACQLTAPTTANNLVVVGLSWQNTYASISEVAGNVSGSYFIPYSEECNSGNVCAAVLLCVNCAAITNVTPTFSDSTVYELNVSEYSGVAWVGITNGDEESSTAPGLNYTTGDANDWVVTETASLGDAGIPAAGAGNLRVANLSGQTSSDVAGALIDNVVATPGTLATTANINPGIWSAAGVELRTAAPKTYIWPDCDATDPCVIHHRDTVAYGTSGDTLSPPFNMWVQPSLPNNLLKLTITHPSEITIGPIVDNNNNTWANGAGVTDPINANTVETFYVCGAATGVNALQIPWTGDLEPFSLVQISYDEISGISTSSCSDGASGTHNVQGAIQPGPITPSQSGDLIYTYGIDTAGGAEEGYPSGWEMADDSSALIMEAPFENFAESVRVYPSTAAINPTLYVWAMDVAEKDDWSIVDQAFKASSGAGTQPPAGHAWVVREMQYYNDSISPLSYLTFPTNGNAVVLQTSNPEIEASLAGIADNLGSTYVLNPVADQYSDPQQYAACLDAGGVAKDRTLTWPTAQQETHVDWYDIAGAKQSTGSGCIGTMTNTNYYEQNDPANSNVVGDPVVTATLNGSAYSVLFTASYVGQGPPAGPCISGGVAPPNCTGDMTIFSMNSIWAQGMQDGSHWYSGDPFGYWYTNSTSPFSVDYLMANGTGSQGLDGAAIEILGQIP
jgi:hypothetical protein